MHLGRDRPLLQHPRESQAGELVALVDVEDLWLAVAGQCLLQGIDAELALRREGQRPTGRSTTPTSHHKRRQGPAGACRHTATPADQAIAPRRRKRRHRLEHAAFTCVHAARSSMCWIARFSAFGDSASTHRALEQPSFCEITARIIITEHDLEIWQSLPRLGLRITYNALTYHAIIVLYKFAALIIVYLYSISLYIWHKSAKMNGLKSAMARLVAPLCIIFRILRCAASAHDAVINCWGAIYLAST